MDRTFDANIHVRDLNKAWNEKDPEVFLQHFSENVDFKDPLMSESVQGKDAFREALTGWFSAIGDVHFHLLESVESDGHVSALMRWSGKHVGEFRLSGGRRIPATNREFVMQVVDALVLDDEGKITSVRPLFDPNFLLEQLGVEADALVAPRT